jgi:hypothetical protein
MLERKVKTHDWATRLNMSLFVMMWWTHTWFTAKPVHGHILGLQPSQSTDSEGTKKDFYHELAEDLIDNIFDGAATGGRRSREKQELLIQTQLVVGKLQGLR